MSVNEADLPTQRVFNSTTSVPVSHVSSGQLETITYVTGPRGDPGPQGDPGPPGADALWEAMTQAAFNALPDKDPNTLYVIIG